MANKEFRLGPLILFVIFGMFTGGCVSTENTVNDELFVVKEGSINDIKGTVFNKKMLIYHRAPTISGEMWGMNVSFIKRSSEGISANLLDVFFIGEKWRYYDKVQIKINDNLYEISVDNPMRGTRSGGNVVEEFNVLLPKEAIEGLKTCSSISIQIDGKNKGVPIQIASEGISKINAFWQNN